MQDDKTRLGARERALLVEAHRYGRLRWKDIESAKRSTERLVAKGLLRDVGGVLFLTDAGEAAANAK